jgi:hypothetical protein
MPAVRVTTARLHGRKVVQVTNTDFPDHYAETLMLDARTGVLVHMRGGTLGGPAGVDVSYRITRVTTPGLGTAR